MRVGIAGVTLLAALTVAQASAKATGTPPQAPPTPMPRLSDAQLQSMDQATLARRLEPLRAVANSVGGAGRTSVADVYGGLVIDANDNLVEVYLTDTKQEARVLAAADAVNPHFDKTLIRFLPAAYPKRTLDTAAARVVDLADHGRLPAKIGMVGPAPDGSALQIHTEDVAATHAAMAARPLRASATAAATAGQSVEAAIGVPIVYQLGHDLEPKSWRDNKWNDTSPFIGGDALTSSGHLDGCTAGLPAVRKSDNHPFMVVAAHCFPVDTNVYTRAGTPGDYNNGILGNWVGRVTEKDTHWDAEIIDGMDNNADESDTNGYLPLTSYSYSYVGDYVCHDGQRSYYLGHPTPCGIKVTNQDIYCGPTTGCPGLKYTSRGVWGDGPWGAAGGDSGATVFSVAGSTARQARGIVSDGDKGDGAPGVFWIEASDIFNRFGLTLNPHT